MSDHSEMDRATFTAMTESTQADWQKIATAANAFNGELASRVLAHLQMLKGDCGGFFGGSAGTFAAIGIAGPSRSHGRGICRVRLAA